MFGMFSYSVVLKTPDAPDRQENHFVMFGKVL
jgi:hypothetical protein